MNQTRYEEYAVFDDKLPFVFYPCLPRTLFSNSPIANWHENPEIQLCLSGEGTVRVDGMEYPFLPGDVVVVNGNALHQTLTQTELQYACLIVDCDFCRQADLDPAVLRFIPHFQDERFKIWFAKLENIVDTPDMPCRSAESRVIVLEMLIALCKDYLQTAPPPGTRDKTKMRIVKETIRYILENYEQKLTLEEIARQVCADKYTLTRIFKCGTGQSIFTFINSYRCQQATALIENGSTISDAARQCGFSNMSFFTRTFRQYMGKQPSDYKKR